MSVNGGEGPDSVKVIRNGILIKKSLEGRGDSPVPRVRFDLVSKREDPVAIRFVDYLPEGLTAEQIVFDPDRSTEFSIGDRGSVRFETQLQPGREFATHYTINEPPNGTDGLLQAPQLESIEAVDGDRIVDEKRDGAGDSSTGEETERSPSDDGGLSSLKGLLSRAPESPAKGSDETDEPSTTVEGPDDSVPAEPSGVPSVQTTTEGVTVTRRLSVEGNGILATIQVRAPQRADECSVVVTDRVATMFDIDVIDYHPSYRPDHGRISTDSVRFRVSIDADQRREIKYGMILWEPVDREDIRANHAQHPPEIELLETYVPAGGPATTLADLFGEDPHLRDGPDGAAILDRIGRAVAAGSVEESSIEKLRDELGVGDVPGSLDARLSHLESRTAEFSAYADTIQTFLDQHGPVAEVFAELENDVKSIRAGLDRFEEQRATIRSRLDRLASDLEQVDQSSATRVRRLRDQLDSLESVHDQDISRVETSLDEVQANLEALQAEVEAEQERWYALSEVFD